MLKELLSSDFFILAILIGLILIVGIVLIILTIKSDKKYKEKTQKEIKNKEKEEKKTDIQIALATDNIPEIDKPYESEQIKEEAPAYELIDDLKMEDATPAILKDEEPVETTTKKVEFLFSEEPEPIKEEVVEPVKTRPSLEDVLSKMEADLEKQKYETIDRYEEDQEENAVISYQELLDRRMALKEDKPKEVIKEVEPDFEVVTTRTTTTYETEEPTYEWNDKPKHFSSSEFVSPIFGRQDSSNNYPTVKKTVETEELKTSYATDDEEGITNETVDLLNQLREYRRNNQ